MPEFISSSSTINAMGSKFSWLPSILSRLIVIMISVVSDYVLTDHDAQGKYYNYVLSL